MGKPELIAPYQFKPGQSGNPGGRPRGARSKLSELTLQKLLRDFEIHGDAVIEQVRTRQPQTYLQCVVSLLPKQQEKIESPLIDLTDHELELLEQFLKSSRAKDVTPIEGEVMPNHGNHQQNNAQREAEIPQPVSRAATERQNVDLSNLTDEEISQRLDNALNSKDRA